MRVCKVFVFIMLTHCLKGLSMFDMCRPTVPVHREDAEQTVTIPLSQLNTEFRCPVCLGILHDTHATMEVRMIPRFVCPPLITVVVPAPLLRRVHLQIPATRVRRITRLMLAYVLIFVNSKKECPSCRVKVPSRRSLRRDTEYDYIIRKLYPNLNKLEQIEVRLRLCVLVHFLCNLVQFCIFLCNFYALLYILLMFYVQDERIQRINDASNSRALAERLEAGLLRQLSTKKTRRRRTRDATAPLPARSGGVESRTATAAASKSADGRPLSDSSQYQFVLTQHPNETTLKALEKPFICTSLNCTGSHCFYCFFCIGR